MDGLVSHQFVSAGILATDCVPVNLRTQTAAIDARTAICTKRPSMSEVSKLNRRLQKCRFPQNVLLRSTWPIAADVLWIVEKTIDKDSPIREHVQPISAKSERLVTLTCRRPLYRSQNA